MKKIVVFLILMLFSFLNVNAETYELPSQIAKVIEAEYVDLSDNDVAQVKQAVKVKITQADFKGQIVDIDNILTGNPYFDINLHKGTKVLLHVEDVDDQLNFSIESVYRSNVLIALATLFSALLIYVGRKKGFYSLVSIALTCVLIFYALSPMILFGLNPVFAMILICLASTAVTMYLVGGFNRKSTSATLGCLLSILFASVLAFLTVKVACLTGFSDESSMFLYSAHPELNFVALSISMIILATLGAVMDVAMSIASTINEIFEVDSSKNSKELFISGMNVGRDIIGTMANTLILVYLGSSLPMLLLASNINVQKFINLNQVVTEISSALIGSIAIIVCVPITAFVASRLVREKRDEVNFFKADA